MLPFVLLIGLIAGLISTRLGWVVVPLAAVVWASAVAADGTCTGSCVPTAAVIGAANAAVGFAVGAAIGWMGQLHRS